MLVATQVLPTGLTVAAALSTRTVVHLAAPPLPPPTWLTYRPVAKPSPVVSKA